MHRTTIVAVVGICAALGSGSAARGRAHPDGGSRYSAQPVVDWSQEARRAIVPAGPGGVFGSENYGNKFPGEAAVYMGIVHAAIYDAALAIEGGYQPYAIALEAPRGTSAAAAVATAAHHTLIGLQPALGLTPAQQAILDGDYAAYLAAIPDDAREGGRDRGRRAGGRGRARARANDGRERNPQLADLVAAARRARACGTPARRRRSACGYPGCDRWRCAAPRSSGPAAPEPEQRRLRRDVARSRRSAAPTAPCARRARRRRRCSGRTTICGSGTTACSPWPRDARLDLVQTARMLAFAHVAGGDAMIACFDAKYAYWFWRPYQAIPHADTDGNHATIADPTWPPLRATPNFPEYPSAHACHTTAISEALEAFFGTDRVSFTLDSRATGTTHRYRRLQEVVQRRQPGAHPGRLPLPRRDAGRLGHRPAGGTLRRAPRIPAEAMSDATPSCHRAGRSGIGVGWSAVRLGWAPMRPVLE